MFKRSILFLCMFVIVSILIINSAFALEIFFKPSHQSVTKGKSAVVDLKIDRKDFGIVAGFDILFSYDTDILSIEKDDIILAETLGSIEFIDSDIEIEPISRTISIYWMAEFAGDEVHQPRFMNLAELNFLAENEGTSDLEITDIVLYDEALIESLRLSIYNPYDIDLMTEIFPDAPDGKIDVYAAQPIPEPSPFLLFGVSFLMGLVYFKRKKIL